MSVDIVIRAIETLTLPDLRICLGGNLGSDTSAPLSVICRYPAAVFELIGSTITDFIQMASPKWSASAIKRALTAPAAKARKS